MSRTKEFERLWGEHHTACVAEDGEKLLQTQERIMVFVEKHHAFIAKALAIAEKLEK